MALVRVRFQPGLKPTIQKHAMHDQSSHGSWARGGNKFNIEETMALQDKYSDKYQSKVYEAEREVFSKGNDYSDIKTMPKFDKTSNDFATYDEYKNAFQEYAKKWDTWDIDRKTDLGSDSAKKFLDGTKKGVEKYADSVMTSDWFVENFGTGSPGIGTPEFKLNTSKNFAGKFELGKRTNLSSRGFGIETKYINRISIQKGYAKNESTILHEIAHWAML